MSTPAVEDDIALSDKKASHHHAPPAHPPTKKLQLFFKRHRHPLIIAGGVIALLAIIYYSYDAMTHEETDDAYVTGHIHNISARIAEAVTEVAVKDNQYVHKGDVLVQLDPSQYQALMAVAEANYKKAQANLDRQQPLVALHAVSPQDLDATVASRDADLAQMKLAQLQIDFASIRAPADGYVGRKNVEVGNRVATGQTLMAVVEPELWVIANFKETQLSAMHEGQPVKITIDSIPGKVFDGTVQSVSPATGNQFALLPADNSTGNFTKIVQRVPVKIVFDPDSTKGYETRIRAGLSAIVKVALTDPERKP